MKQCFAGNQLPDNKALGKSPGPFHNSCSTGCLQLIYMVTKNRLL